MLQVCEGRKTKNDMVEQAINQYKDIFIKAKNGFAKVVDVSYISNSQSTIILMNVICRACGSGLMVLVVVTVVVVVMAAAAAAAEGEGEGEEVMVMMATVMGEEIVEVGVWVGVE
jgi:hypothetical protein